MKGLLLLSETFNVTDLAPAVLKRIEEVKKKTGEEDIYSGKKTQEEMEKRPPPCTSNFPPEIYMKGGTQEDVDLLLLKLDSDQMTQEKVENTKIGNIVRRRGRHCKRDRNFPLGCQLLLMVR